MSDKAETPNAERFLPTRVVVFLRRKLIQIISFGLISLGVLLSLALLSYAPSDPSWNTAAPISAHNWLGTTGAVIADLSMQIIGLGSGMIPLAFCFWGWGLWRGTRKVPSRKHAGLLLASLPAWAAAAAALPPAVTWGPEASWGGLIGAGLINLAHPLLIHWEPVSHTVFGFVFLAAGLILASAALDLKARDWQRAGAAGWRWIAWTSLRIAAGLSSLTGIFSNQKDPTPERPIRKSPIITAPSLRDTPASHAKDQQSTADSSDISRPLSPGSDYTLPALSLLKQPPRGNRNKRLDHSKITENAQLLETVLKDFNVRGTIINIRPGPIVTLYEWQPAPGTKAARVIGLADDIARSMSAQSARIASITGRNAIGIELPNPDREMVYLREQLATSSFIDSQALLPLALGKDIGGDPVIADLANMPHLLIAGTTGSGKSVAVNTMILSLLYRMSPEECRLVMIDPKMLELSVYDDIPHLLSPVVTDPKKAVTALKWTVREMERRYRIMSSMGVRSLAAFNQRIATARQTGEVLTRRVQTGFDPETHRPVFENLPLDLTPLPLIVVVVDEMADLMMTAGKEIENAIQRLSQMARAAGIHLIMATQRPSVDVITGTIKANFPTRISFQVTSKIDSRTILGEQGAEQLLGQGDMLYMAAGGRIQRVHGPFVADHEVERVVNHLRAQGMPQYIEDVTQEPPENQDTGGDLITGESNRDQLYDNAVALVAREGKASTSFVQRHLQIGYNRAARLIERMENEGIISPANHVGKREVLLARPDIH